MAEIAEESNFKPSPSTLQSAAQGPLGNYCYPQTETTPRAPCVLHSVLVMLLLLSNESVDDAFGGDKRIIFQSQSKPSQIQEIKRYLDSGFWFN